MVVPRSTLVPPPPTPTLGGCPPFPATKTSEPMSHIAPETRAWWNGNRRARLRIAPLNSSPERSTRRTGSRSRVDAMTPPTNARTR